MAASKSATGETSFAFSNAS